VQVIPAVIRQIDLIKHRVLLVSLEGAESHERSRETASTDPSLG
jgi:hypothetical protein